MKNSDWAKWASIAEIFGTLAILTTLLFLLVGLRQNTQAIEQTAAWMRLTSLDSGFEQNSVWRKKYGRSIERGRGSPRSLPAGEGQRPSERQRYACAPILICVGFVKSLSLPRSCRNQPIESREIRESNVPLGISECRHAPYSKGHSGSFSLVQANYETFMSARFCSYGTVTDVECVWLRW